MKRILAVLLSFVMLLSLISCSSSPEEKKKKGEEKEDLSELSAAELYAYGVEKNHGLTSALYTTKVLSDAQVIYEIETARIRSGYEGYSYSRKGNGLLAFTGDTAYVDTASGRFTATTTSRVFDEYLEEFVFPVYGLDEEKLSNFSRDGDKVTYEVADEKLLSLYGDVSSQIFFPKSLSGVAEMDEEGVIQKETITVKGVGETGEEMIFAIETALSKYRSDEIEITLPEDQASFVLLEDIRLPQRIEGALAELLLLSEIHATLVSSNTMTLGKQKYSLNQDINVYRAKDGEKYSYYLSKQSLKQIPDQPEESLFYQCLLADGTKTENLYNVILGEKLSENITSAEEISWSEEIEKLLLGTADLATLSMAEEVGGYSVRFTLNDSAANRIALALAASFPESAFSPSVVEVKEMSGTLSIDREKGILTALSYSVSGTLAGGETDGGFTGRYSVLVDQTEGVELPPLQTPTPTTPGMEDEHGHDYTC